MTDRLAEIKERLDKAQKDPQVFEIEDRTEGWFECPLCDTNCPICENGGGAPGNQWVYKNLAAGITVFGIGDDLENLEAFAKHAPDDIKWLIEELERERAESSRLRNNMAILKQEWKELSVESETNPCFERDCVRRSKWVFTPADKQYYCAVHAAINREKWGL